MIDLLRHPVFRVLFAAQVLSLLGAGLMTVALALLAYDLAGANAGVVLGTALTIKMVAYVGIAPILSGFGGQFDRRRLLIGLDIFRATIALTLPFVTEVWQIYVLVFVLQCASALFTPTFQAMIPDVLEDEAAYTRALSLSRAAYDLESLTSPALAAALLLIMPFHALFAGTSLGFLASAALVFSVVLPVQAAARQEGFGKRVTRGLRIYLATPRLRGLLSVTLAAAAASAFVIVNTVVIVRTGLGREASAVAMLLGAYGAGSMTAAFALPGILERFGDRRVMLTGASALALLLGLAAVWQGLGELVWSALLVLWFLLGASYASVLTPAGRLLTRSSARPDRASVFAAQFALSHGCWLVTYPLAGYLGAAAGMSATFAVMAALSALGVVLAIRNWPEGDPQQLPHRHEGLAPDHPHLAQGDPLGDGHSHVHAFIIDDMHPHWPDKH